MGSLVLSQAKLKSAVQLQDLLDATRLLLPRARFGNLLLKGQFQVFYHYMTIA